MTEVLKGNDLAKKIFQLASKGYCWKSISQELRMLESDLKASGANEIAFEEGNYEYEKKRLTGKRG